MDQVSAGASVATVASIAVCMVASVVGIFIYDYSTPPCECPCVAEQYESRCQLIPLFMKVPLIATHLIPFILMPVSMWVCQMGAETLHKKGMKSTVQVVLGLAYIMVSISGEVGWHVHQRWFYHEDFDVLNFFFYGFNTLGACMWGLGAQTEATKSRFWDVLLMLSTPLTALVYAWAAYATYVDLQFGASKVPIYVIMAIEYGVLSWRLFKLLNNDIRVWLFPFFSVGVNLFFVFLLSKFQTNLILNPLFHILHDAAGTEMGILVITIIIWSATSSNSAAIATKKSS